MLYHYTWSSFHQAQCSHEARGESCSVPARVSGSVLMRRWSRWMQRHITSIVQRPHNWHNHSAKPLLTSRARSVAHLRAFNYLITSQKGRSAFALRLLILRLASIMDRALRFPYRLCLWRRALPAVCTRRGSFVSVVFPSFKWLMKMIFVAMVDQAFCIGHRHMLIFESRPGVHFLLL